MKKAKYREGEKSVCRKGAKTGRTAGTTRGNRRNHEKGEEKKDEGWKVLTEEKIKGKVGERERGNLTKGNL